jgi:hypothetical protein
VWWIKSRQLPHFVLNLLDMTVSFQHCITQGTKHYAVYYKQKDQERDQLNNNRFIDRDQGDVADNLHRRFPWLFIASGENYAMLFK